MSSSFTHKHEKGERLLQSNHLDQPKLIVVIFVVSTKFYAYMCIQHFKDCKMNN
jgi:hypothetical protein